MKRLIKASTDRSEEDIRNWDKLFTKIKNDVSSASAKIQSNYSDYLATEPDLDDPEELLDNYRDAFYDFARALTDLIISGAE